MRNNTLRTHISRLPIPELMKLQKGNRSQMTNTPRPAGKDTTAIEESLIWVRITPLLRARIIARANLT
jgi:hypothetical protein